MNSTTRISAMHPMLQIAEAKFAVDYQRDYFADHYLKVTTAYRSSADQFKAFQEGRSKVLCGNHNTYPSFAIDFTVFDTKGTPTKIQDDKPTWENKYYTPLGKLAEKYGVFWGGNYKGFFDGPHIEIPSGLIAVEYQMLLKIQGLYAGALDGMFGKKSLAALSEYCKRNKLNPNASHNVYGVPWNNSDTWTHLWTKVFGADESQWVAKWKAARAQFGLPA
jgi:hypothetical protein